MPIGILTDSLCLLAGSLIGGGLAGKLSEKLTQNLTILFGIASMAIGVNSIVKMTSLPAVVLAIIVGYAIGHALRLEARIMAGAKGVMARLKWRAGDSEWMGLFTGALVLFCASGTGIYGALQEGMTGDPSVMLAKGVLDFFTAIIFAATLGRQLALLCVPQLAVLGALYGLSHLILPLVSPAMLLDFSACGGVVMLVTGLHVSKIKPFPLLNLLPAFVLVMPASWVYALLQAGV